MCVCFCSFVFFLILPGWGLDIFFPPLLFHLRVKYKMEGGKGLSRAATNRNAFRSRCFPLTTLFSIQPGIVNNSEIIKEHQRGRSKSNSLLLCRLGNWNGNVSDEEWRIVSTIHGLSRKFSRCKRKYTNWWYKQKFIFINSIYWQEYTTRIRFVASCRA